MPDKIVTMNERLKKTIMIYSSTIKCKSYHNYQEIKNSKPRKQTNVIDELLKEALQTNKGHKKWNKEGFSFPKRLNSAQKKRSENNKHLMSLPGENLADQRNFLPKIKDASTFEDTESSKARSLKTLRNSWTHQDLPNIRKGIQMRMENKKMMQFEDDFGKTSEELRKMRIERADDWSNKKRSKLRKIFKTYIASTPGSVRALDGFLD